MSHTDCPEKQTALPEKVELPSKGYLVFKRCLDVVIAFTMLLVLWFPMLLIGAWVWLDSPGKALFKQERIGRNGKVFLMYKFRSMHVTAPSDMATRDFKDSEDYITRAGAILRRTSLDELPQLLNILKGDMSFVGYRPVCTTEEELNDKRARCGVLAARPGLTGLAQVCGRDDVDIDEKVVLDAKYVANCSLKMDIWCLFKTVAVVITGEGNK